MRSLRSPTLQAALWTVLVGIGMLLPGDALPPVDAWLPASLEAWVDKVEHFVAFFVMTILLYRALRSRGASERPLLSAALSSLGYAVLLEMLQIPHPSRHWAPADLVADALGIAAGAAAAVWIGRS